jgi:hypothetical protein
LSFQKKGLLTVIYLLLLRHPLKKNQKVDHVESVVGTAQTAKAQVTGHFAKMHAVTVDHELAMGEIQRSQHLIARMAGLELMEESHPFIRLQRISLRWHSSASRFFF